MKSLLFALVLFGGLWAVVAAQMAAYDRDQGSREPGAVEAEPMPVTEEESRPPFRRANDEGLLNFGREPGTEILSAAAILFASFLIALRKRAGLVFGSPRRRR